MPFIPHTETDIEEMLKALSEPSLEQLWDEIPKELKIKELQNIPEGLNEMSLKRLMQERASKDTYRLNFIGAGAYEHHIPAAVFDLISRGEFLTSYTPYQAEASQGTLQILYEFQTMMSNLMCLDVSNASMYDGASALAEAILMAIRCNKEVSNKRILVPKTLHPAYRRVIRALGESISVDLIEIPFLNETGCVSVEDLKKYAKEKFVALVIPAPNFFGHFEAIHDLTDFAHEQKAMVIGVVNPMAMAIFSPPGEWGKSGADIACGEGQPLGVPLSSGGPYFGFLCCKERYVRQMPGRIVGRTLDRNQQEGFTLTLQAREQHIRRSKATSNICTNQGLLVTAASIYMSLLGPEGLKSVSKASHQNARWLMRELCSLSGVELIFSGFFFHEFVLRIPEKVDVFLGRMAKVGIQAGFNLSSEYPLLGNAILVCVTETKTQEDLGEYVNCFKQSIAKLPLVEPLVVGDRELG